MFFVYCLHLLHFISQDDGLRQQSVYVLLECLRNSPLGVLEVVDTPNCVQALVQIISSGMQVRIRSCISVAVNAAVGNATASPCKRSNACLFSVISAAEWSLRNGYGADNIIL